MSSPQRLCLFALFFLFFSTYAQAATTTPKSSTLKSSSSSSSSPSTARSTSTSSSTTSSSGGSVASTIPSVTSTPTVPDVLLNVPTLSVGLIELVVENLQADINLNANVAGLVSINAGVAVSIQTVNLTIANVDAELELIVRLGHLVDIVSRVFQSLDLNPLLITALNDTTSLVDAVVGAVDGLLGTITQGGTTLSFIVDNLGNIVQEVTGAAGAAVSTIVGNYLTNMTFTGVSQTLSSGFVEKTYSYSPLNALVDIVFNAAGQVVQATVEKQTGSSTSSIASATSASASVATTTA